MNSYILKNILVNNWNNFSVEKQFPVYLQY